MRDNHPGDPPVFLRAYVLNITNLAEVQAGGKPVLVSRLRGGGLGVCMGCMVSVSVCEVDIDFQKCG